jgi:hypothetical protein
MKTLLTNIHIALLILPGLFVLSNCKKPSTHTLWDDVSGKAGKERLNDVIVHNDSPFLFEWPSKPSFPANEVAINTSGILLSKPITDLIQQAIDQVHEQGGGRVIIPAGEWLSGRIILKSNVNLHFEDGATLCFSGEIEDYQPAVFTRIEGVEVMSFGACIYAHNAENIAITGKGTLIGPADGPVRTQYNNKIVIDLQIDPQTPVADRIYDGINSEFIFLPMFISPIECKNVYIEGLTLQNSAFWNIVPIYCDGVVIRGVDIHSIGIPRGDGIDIESSRNVLIEYCTFNNGDDCIALKAGRGPDGLRVNRPTENVVIRYCHAQRGIAGVAFGSETAGTIRNVWVHDFLMGEVGLGISFKTRRPRGGGAENLFFERIAMRPKNTAIKWDMLGGKGAVGDLANRLPLRETNELTPFYRNISMKDIWIEGQSHFLKIEGLPEMPVENISFQHMTVKSSKLMQLADARNVTFTDISFETDEPLIEALNLKSIGFKNVRFQSDTVFVKTSEMEEKDLVFDKTIDVKIEFIKTK